MTSWVVDVHSQNHLMAIRECNNDMDKYNSWFKFGFTQDSLYLQ